MKNNDSPAQEKIIWVNNWKDIPSANSSPDVEGYYHSETGTIYLVKGKASRTTVYHEIAHSIKGHHSTYPEEPRKFVHNEIDADIWSYQQIGRPRTIISHLRAILFDLITPSIYNLKSKTALEIIAEVLNELQVPIQWKENLSKLSREWNITFKVH